MSVSKKRSAVEENSEAKNAKKLRNSNINGDDDTNYTPMESSLSDSIAEQILNLEKVLGQKLQKMKFPNPVKHVYNPIDYAFEVHAAYVRRFCNNVKKILFLGMNPGPWGMSQTGVPFGEVKMVKEWFKLSGNIGKPTQEHPDRKVTGFNCTRSEISGKRLWALFKDLCGEPENFFREAYMHNYCPIALMDAKGKNITPAELKGPEQNTLHELCDSLLICLVKLLKVDVIVGIGKFAEKRAETVAKSANLPVKILCLPHPSPRAVGNNNWNEKALKKLEELNLLKHFVKQVLSS